MKEIFTYPAYMYPLKRTLHLFVLFLFVGLSTLRAQVTIPSPLVVDATLKRPIPLDGSPQQYALASLAVNSSNPVFSCTGGNYYVGFQLVYELGDMQTQVDWNVDLSLNLYNSGTAVWAAPKTLSLKMTRNDPVYVATVFHDVVIPCSGNYTFKITAKNLGATPPQSNIYLKVLLHKVDDSFNQAATLNFNVVNGNDESFLTWAFVTASDEKSIMGYDVEWVFIDNYELNNLTISTNADAFVAKEPVRVTTISKSYTHATFYPSGKIYYRVRPVGFNASAPGHRIPGNTWTYFGPIALTNHQGDKNWQLQSVYAEEGKYKKVVSYYDGSLRNRQSLTNLSSEDLTLAGESRYDYEGRKVLDLLPVPLIVWQNLTNTFADGGTVSKSLSAAAGWNGSATSVEQIPANKDGFVEVKVDDITSLRAFGLSVNSANTSYTGIKHALYLNGTSVKVYENGTSPTGSPTVTVKLCDILSVVRNGTSVQYRLNNQTFYTSALSTTNALYTAAAIYTPGSKVVVVGGVPTPPLTYVSNLNPFLRPTNTTDPIYLGTQGTRTKFFYDNGALVNSTINNTGGAGKYYSPSNPGQSKDYIPDAEGYVYSQVEFTNDGTGHVRKQSGVGKAFALEGTHTTQYYYGNAAPIEIMRLFGSNVGNASHYKKNMVVDPNGQASVSYHDQEGRVIATAMAGVSPTNLEALSSNVIIPNQTVDISRENFKRDGVSKISHKIINTGVNSLYTFTYTLSSQSITIPASCLTCTYDLKITLTDPNGKLVNLNYPSVIAGNQAPTDPNDADSNSYIRKALSPPCGSLTSLVNVSIPVTLTGLGDYTITKILTPSDYTYAQARAAVLADPAVTAQITSMTAAYNDPLGLGEDNANCAVCGTVPSDTLALVASQAADRECDNLASQIGANPGLACKYTLYCTTDKKSEVFDKQLALVSTWTDAVAKGYNNLATVSSLKDPFFAAGSSGASYITQMQTMLNQITLENIMYDSNNDGVPDHTIAGAISNITDPNNTAFWINYNGKLDATSNGHHVLYWHQQQVSTSSAALDQQRWALFKGFYLEAKRKLKLTIPAYSGCSVVYNELKTQTPGVNSTSQLSIFTGNPYQNISTATTWGTQQFNNDFDQTITLPEINSILYNIQAQCDIASFNGTDQSTLTTLLTNYFTNDPKPNFFHIIRTSDVGVNSSLVSVAAILNTPAYNNCQLSTVATVDPVGCATGTGSPLISINKTGGTISSSCSTPGCASGCATNLTVTMSSGLVVGKTYRLRFAYLPSSLYYFPNGTATTGEPNVYAPSANVKVQLTRSTTNTSTCNQTLPATIDPIYIGSSSTTSTQLWNTTVTNTVANYVSIDFRPTAASTMIVFAVNVSSKYSASVTISDVSIAEYVAGETPAFTNPPVCYSYNADPWNIAPNWSSALANCLNNAAAKRQILIDSAKEQIINAAIGALLTNQRTNCLKNAVEALNYTFGSSEYQYTLYYYDQAGNLVQTVPPSGVVPLTLTAADVNNMFNGTKLYPSHKLISRYQFNSLNQVIVQTTPDAGVTSLYYNSKGQLKLSQNAQQLIDNNYSYSKFDTQGRAIEVGEMNVTTPDNLGTLLLEIDNIAFPIATASRVLGDVTKTYYDVPSTPFATNNFVRNRVSYVEVYDKGAPLNDVTTTYYNYDIHGNVNAVIQQITGLPNKRVDYVYDLVTGKVKYVVYQAGNPDQFIHQYKYDADNRITEVLTSTDGYVFDSDARYKYYLHGPLARAELGQYRVQGEDYYYTLQGWLKGVNMPTYSALLPAASATPDPGKDGYNGLNLRVGRDVFGFALGYYNGDYKASNSAVTLVDSRDGMWTRVKDVYGAVNDGLYNGNIAWMATDLKRIGQNAQARCGGIQTMAYKYDQLNRLVHDRSFSYSRTSGITTTRTPSGTASYDEDFSYDPNGNFLTLQRRDNNNSLVDDFSYTYYPNSNRLQYYKPPTQFQNKTFSGAIATDNTIYNNIIIAGTAYVPSGTAATIRAISNITFQNGFNSSTTSNKTLRAFVQGTMEGTYNYDAIGNLTYDQEKFFKIAWTPEGKVRSITKDDGTSTTTFRYDGEGNRIEKKSIVNGVTTITRYIRDANGIVLAVYSGGTGVTLAEQPIYGSSRIGIYNAGVGQRAVGVRQLGQKNFELTNHLGNVLAAVNDNVNMTVDSTWTNVVNAADYYAYGSNMPGRTFDATGVYRYGFGGQEKDVETGPGIYTAEFWEYDSKLGRRWNLDPVSDPSQSPYVCFNDNPIAFNDPNGDCPDCPDEGVQSKYLGGIGIDMGSFGNGIADGFIGALPDMAGFAWDMLTSEDAREEFMTGIKTMLSDIPGTIKAFAAEKLELYQAVLSGEGTEEQKYEVGKELGDMLFGVASGAAAAKLTELIKVAKYEKKLVKAAEAADKATVVNKSTRASVKGTKIHSKFEEIVGSDKAEVSYKGKKIAARRGEKGSIRADAIYGTKSKPKIAYDLKTGNSGISKAEAANYRKHLPKGTKLKEISKNVNGKYTIKTIKKK